VSLTTTGDFILVIIIKQQNIFIFERGSHT